MTDRWLPIVLAAVGSAALGIGALLRQVEYSAQFADAGPPLLLSALGPAVVGISATLAAWLVPAARLASAGAIIALAALSGWAALLGLIYPFMNVSAATTIGALLLGLAGVLMVTGRDALGGRNP